MPNDDLHSFRKASGVRVHAQSFGSLRGNGVGFRNAYYLLKVAAPPEDARTFLTPVVRMAELAELTDRPRF